MKISGRRLGRRADRRSGKQSMRTGRLSQRRSGEIEPLEERCVLAGNVLAAIDGNLATSAEVNELTLSVLQGGGSHILGLRVHATNGSGMNPGVAHVFQNGAPIPGLFESPDVNGGLDSLLLVELGPGDFTVEVGSDGGAGDYTLEVLLLGDENQDHVVDDQEILMATAGMVQAQFGGNHVSAQFFRDRGVDFSQDLYRAEFDANFDGVLDPFDVDVVEHNLNLPMVQVEITGDDEAPVIGVALLNDTGRSATDAITMDATVTGAVTDASDLASFTVSVNGGAASSILSEVDPGDGSFTLTAADLAAAAGGTLNDGTIALTFSASDTLGNATVTPVTLTYQLDRMAPAAPAMPDLLAADDSGASSTDNITNDTTPRFNVNAETAALVELFSNRVVAAIGSTTINGSNQIAVGTPLVENTHQITATATDVAGNTSAASSALALTIDLTAPTINTFDLAAGFDSPPAGDRMTDQTPVTLAGTTQAGIAVELDNTGATTTASGSGAFTFPNVALPFGETDFTVIATDLAGNSTQRTETFTRNNAPVEDTPLADINIDEDTVAAQDIDISGVFDDANLGEGDSLTLTVIGNTNPSLVDASVTGSTLTLDYLANANGSAQVTLQAEDSFGATATSTVDITVNPVNDAPQTMSTTLTTDEDVAVTIDLRTLVSDIETLDDDLIFSVGGAVNGAVVLQANGHTARFTPAANFNGAASFTYQVTDTGDGADPAITTAATTINVTVDPVNDPPVTNATTLMTDEEVAVDVDLRTLVSDLETADDDLSFNVSGAANGSVSLLADGHTARFTPATNFNDEFAATLGPATFTYTVTDDGDGSAAAITSDPVTITINVDPVNDPPMAVNDSITVPPDVVTMNRSMIANDQDADLPFDTLTVVDIDTTGTVGIVTDNGDGTFDFDPDGNFDNLGPGDSAMTSFTYTIEDEEGEQSTATVTLTITLNSVTAVDDSFGTPGDNPAQILEDSPPVNLTVLDNDVDDQGDSFTIVSVTQGSEGGSVSIDTGGGNSGQDSITYEPDDNFNGTETFTYTIEDDEGAQDTATVTVTVTQVNDQPLISNQTFDVDENSPNTTIVGTVTASDLENHTLTYSIAGGNVGGAFAINSATGEITVSNSNALDFETITSFSLTVMVTDNDSPPASSTATITINLNDVPDGPSVQIEVVARPQPTASADFDVFVATSSSTSNEFARAILRTNGGNSMDYVIASPNFTGGTLTTLSFNNNGGMLFNALSDPDRTTTVRSGVTFIEGTWDTSEGLTPAFISQFQSGAIFVNAAINGGTPSKVGGQNLAASAEVVDLPNSVDQFVVGQTYVLEIWVQDILPDSPGISSVLVDIQFDPALSQVPGDNAGLHHDGPLSFLPQGVVDNGAGLITGENEAAPGFGGSTALPPAKEVGVGAFARLGFVEFTATAAGMQEYDVTFKQGTRQGGGEIQSGEVQVDSRNNSEVQHVAPSTFNILGSSTITVGGTVNGQPLQPQTSGADMTGATGTINLVVDDFDNPTSITFAGANVDFVTNSSGPFNPGNAPGDFGFIVGTTNIAIRQLLADIMSGSINVDASGNFDTSQLTTSLSMGSLDRPDGFGGVLSTSLVGRTLTDAGAADGTLTEVSPGVFQLTIPLNHTIDISDIVPNSQLMVSATINAQFTPPPPLNGTESGGEAVEGTRVEMRLVKTPTPVGTGGHVSALPKSETWIDEWDSYYVELWVGTDGESGVDSAYVDLAYNERYFTATRVEHGNLYSLDARGIIDDSAGIVLGLGGKTAAAGAGVGGYALLGRVKFEALSGDQVPFSAKPMDSHAIGLALEGARMTVDGAWVTDAVLGESPKTELLPVVFDVDDNDVVDFGDFAAFSGSFLQNSTTILSARDAGLDFNKDGRIDFGDFSSFAANFLVRKGSRAEVVFPESFHQRWLGLSVDANGETPVHEVLDAAARTWQTALGAVSPIDVDLVVRNFGDTQLGSAQILEVDASGRPVRGRVTIDDDGAGLGWYSGLDSAVPQGSYDLYTVFMHEIGHALGFTESYAGFASHVETAADGSKTFVGPSFTAQLDNAGLHLDPNAHPGDVMNATLEPGERKVPSALDVAMLYAAYDAAAAGARGFSSSSAPLHAAAPARLSVSAVLSDLARDTKAAQVDAALSIAFSRGEVDDLECADAALPALAFFDAPRVDFSNDATSRSRADALSAADLLASNRHAGAEGDTTLNDPSGERESLEAAFAEWEAAIR